MSMSRSISRSTSRSGGEATKEQALQRIGSISSDSNSSVGSDIEVGVPANRPRGCGTSLPASRSSDKDSTLSFPPLSSPTGQWYPNWMLVAGDSHGIVTITRGCGSSVNRHNTSLYGLSRLPIMPANTISVSLRGKEKEKVDMRDQTKALAMGVSAMIFVSSDYNSTSSSMYNGYNSNMSELASTSVDSLSSKNSHIHTSHASHASHTSHTTTTTTTTGNSLNSVSDDVSDLLAVGTVGGDLAVVCVQTGSIVFQTKGHIGAVTDLAVGTSCRRGSEFLSCGVDRNITLWSINSRGIGLGGSAAVPLARLISVDSTRLGSPTLLKCAPSPVTGLSVGGRDSSLLLSSSAEGLIRMWDLAYDLHSPCRLPDPDPYHRHTDRVTAMHWNSNEEHCFYTASHDGTVRVWDSISGHCQHFLNVFPGSGNGEDGSAEGITAMSVSSLFTLPLCATSSFSSLPEGEKNNSFSHRRCIVTSSWSGKVRVHCSTDEKK